MPYFHTFKIRNNFAHDLHRTLFFSSLFHGHRITYRFVIDFEHKNTLEIHFFPRGKRDRFPKSARFLLLFFFLNTQHGERGKEERKVEGRDRIAALLILEGESWRREGEQGGEKSVTRGIWYRHRAVRISGPPLIYERNRARRGILRCWYRVSLRYGR